VRRLILILATLCATTTATAIAAATTPLAHQLLATGELRGYTATSAKTLELDRYARTAGLDPEAKQRLAVGGFAGAAVETLRGPSRLPANAGPSQSSVLRFETASQATSMLRWIKRTYRNAAPKSIKRAPLAVPGLNGDWSTHYWAPGAQGRIDEYNVYFALGRNLYEIDVFSAGGALTAARAATGLASYHKRLAHG
jgi:hypothetical protein